MKAILDSDCLLCHGGIRVDAGYRVNTYADVMKGVVAGSANSKLVTTTSSSRGSMYRYLSGSAATKASIIQQWVVTYKAQQTR